MSGIKRPIALALCGLLMAACSSAGETAYREGGRAQLARAEALFWERCQTAGEKIYRTAEKVEGIFLMKLRLASNYGKQFEMDDPYGHDSTADEYFNSFLVGRNQNGFLTRREDAVRPGYRYVEALDPQDGKRYRYTGRIDQPWLRDKRYGEWVREFALDKTPSPGPMPRYGVTYDDISTREEREYWIAGSSLKVIDLKTNEVMAERIGYMMDRGQGSRGGGRSPWLLAADNACPTFQRNPFSPIPPGRGASAQPRQAQDFVEKVLKPIQEK